MLGSALFVAMAVCGIEVGWQPDPQGNLQYIIQIEPEMVDTLLTGRAIEYDLPPEHRGVHRFRFQVGKGQPPRLGDPAPPKPRETAVRRADQGGGLAPLWKSAAEPPAGPAQQDSPQKKVAVEPPGEQPRLELPVVTGAKVPDQPLSASTAPRVPQGVPPATGPSESPSVALLPPDKLPANPDSKPIPEQKAGFMQSKFAGDSGSAAGAGLPVDEKLMAPLVITACTAVGLFAACVYLCWIYAGTRRRYRALLADYYAAVGSMPGFGSATLADPSRDE